MMVYYVALGIGIVAGIAGQILLKTGADSADFVSQLLRPSTLCGLALYGSAAFLYLIALRKIPVSVAFPSVSLSYAIVAVPGPFFFGETFGHQKDPGHPAPHGRRGLRHPGSRARPLSQGRRPTDPI